VIDHFGRQVERLTEERDALDDLAAAEEAAVEAIDRELAELDEFLRPRPGETRGTSVARAVGVAAGGAEFGRDQNERVAELLENRAVHQTRATAHRMDVARRDAVIRRYKVAIERLKQGREG